MSFRLHDLQCEALGLKERICGWLEENKIEHDGLRETVNEMLDLLDECEWLKERQDKAKP